MIEADSETYYIQWTTAGETVGVGDMCNRLVTSTGELHWAHSRVSRVQAGMLLGRRILEGPGAWWEENIP